VTELKNPSKSTHKSSSLAVIGTVAIDAVKTPFGSKDQVFGGSASYFSYAASYFTSVAVVAVVGKDFPEEYRSVLQERNIDLSHLVQAEGKTFFWRGEYGSDLNVAHTLDTQLNVLQDFNPQLNFRTLPSFVFLANIDPALQLSVLDQIHPVQPKFIACDTMNFWIANKKPELLKVLSRVDGVVLNDGEIRELTGETNLINAARKVQDSGPSRVILKKGEHGVLLFDESRFFALPAYPLEEVFDPTGAGDSFGGGMMGYLAECGDTSFENLKRAIAYGTMTASFAVEDFSLEGLRRSSREKIEERLEVFRKMCSL